LLIMGDAYWAPSPMPAPPTAPTPLSPTAPTSSPPPTTSISSSEPPECDTWCITSNCAARDLCPIEEEWSSCFGTCTNHSRLCDTCQVGQGEEQVSVINETLLTPAVATTPIVWTTATALTPFDEFTWIQVCIPVLDMRAQPVATFFELAIEVAVPITGTNTSGGQICAHLPVFCSSAIGNLHIHTRFRTRCREPLTIAVTVVNCSMPRLFNFTSAFATNHRTHDSDADVIGVAGVAMAFVGLLIMSILCFWVWSRNKGVGW
jgi:hypothetical protein